MGRGKRNPGREEREKLTTEAKTKAMGPGPTGPGNPAGTSMSPCLPAPTGLANEQLLLSISRASPEQRACLLWVN